MIPFKKGKRGIIFLDNRNGAKVIVKKKNPSASVDTLSNEAEFLKLLNKHNIGPRFISFDGESLVMEFIDGMFIDEYLENSDRKKMIKIINNVLEQCYTMDKLGITKFEMTRPYKHIIVRNRKDGINNADESIMIDFERCRNTAEPKNVTQFLQFLTNSTITKTLSDKGIKLNKDEIISISKEYKNDMSIENLEKIMMMLR